VSRGSHRRTWRWTTDCGSPHCSTSPERRHPWCSSAEVKDYIDIDAILRDGRVDLPTALASSKAIYGRQSNPQITLKALSFFDDGNLRRLPKAIKDRLANAAREADLDRLPTIGVQGETSPARDGSGGAPDRVVRVIRRSPRRPDPLHGLLELQAGPLPGPADAAASDGIVLSRLLLALNSYGASDNFAQMSSGELGRASPIVSSSKLPRSVALVSVRCST
jgi:hypothetical protein